MSTLQIVDDDLTTVLLDLNGTNAGYGDVTWKLLSDVDFGAGAYESGRLDYAAADGGTTTTRYARLTPVTFRVAPNAASYDALAEGVNRLATLLAAGGTIKWVPTGSTTVRYRDFEPSDTPVLLDGRELGIFAATTLFTSLDGVTLRLVAQPFFYGPALDSADNLLANATLLLDRTAGDSGPDAWAWDSMTNITAAAVVASREAYAATIATTGTRRFQQTTPSGTVTGSATYTASIYARVVAGSNARLTLKMWGLDSGGSAAGSTHASPQTTLTTTWQRITVTGAVGASAVRAIVSAEYDNSTATAVTVEMFGAQLEPGSAVSPFHVGNETIDADPTASRGRVVLLYNPGSAPVPVRVRAQPVTPASVGAYRVALLPSDGIAGRNAVADYANGAYVLQAEDMNAGTDTALFVGGSAYSGAGSNTMRTTFAGNNTNVPERLAATFAVGIDALAGLSWQLWGRVGVTYSTGASPLSVTIEPSIGGVRLPEVDVDLTTNAYGFDVPLGTFHVEEDALDFRLGLRAIRRSGTSSLLWDAFFFVPIGHANAKASLPTDVYFKPVGLGDVALLSDPDLPGARATTGFGGQVIAGRKVSIAGPVPCVAPPGLSAVYVAGTFDTSSLGASHDTSPLGSQTVGFEFYPRYHA